MSLEQCQEDHLEFNLRVIISLLVCEYSLAFRDTLNKPGQRGVSLLSHSTRFNPINNKFCGNI